MRESLPFTEAELSILKRVLVIGALAVGLLGVRTAGKSLEQITAEKLGRLHT